MFNPFRPPIVREYEARIRVQAEKMLEMEKTMDAMLSVATNLVRELTRKVDDHDQERVA